MTTTRDLDTTVVFHAGRRSGEPTIGDSRLALSFLLSYVWNDGFEATRLAYELERPPLLHACWFAGIYGIDGWRQNGDKRVITGKIWRKRWGAWAQQWEQQMWLGKDWDSIPDPPSVTD